MIFPKRICLRWDWKNRKRIPLETLLQKWYQWTKQNRFRDSENKLMAVSREQCVRDSYEDWDLCVQTTSFKVSNQQGPTVQHGKLCAVLCGRMNGKGVWGEWIRVSMTGSLCCPPETVTSLLICGGGGVVAKSCPTLVTLPTVACQASLTMGFYKIKSLKIRFLNIKAGAGYI